MVGLGVADMLLPVGLAVLLPLWVAWTAYRGVSVASRGASFVRMGIAALVGVSAESARRSLGLSWGEVFAFAGEIVGWAFDVAAGLV